MRKIYCFSNGGSPGWMSAIALAEDGVCVAFHTCSHEGYMQHDLGITSDWKHDQYNEHFGAGNWELEWVSQEDFHGHEGLQKAIELNQTEAERKQKETNKTNASEEKP